MRFQGKRSKKCKIGRNNYNLKRKRRFHWEEISWSMKAVLPVSYFCFIQIACLLPRFSNSVIRFIFASFILSFNIVIAIKRRGVEKKLQKIIIAIKEQVLVNNCSIMFPFDSRLFFNQTQWNFL